MVTETPAPGLRDQLIVALRTIEKLQDRVRDQAAAARSGADEPVAIVGTACRLPGGADSPEEFWQLLRNGVDAITDFPGHRADAARLLDPDPDAPGKAYTVRGGFINGVDKFEPEVFGISRREAVGMDPQQRLALEVSWEALEAAGQAPDRLEGTRTGVFFGVSTTDYVRARQQRGDIRDVDAYQLIGEPSFIAGRISYVLGLRGPSKIVDTACSSSLVALHDAVTALRQRECDLAVVGGVNLLLDPYGFVIMSKFGALAKDGRCKTFDAAADGYARGEGAVAFVLKRASDAAAAGDTVLALVRGTAVNHDGRSSGLTVPNPAAQQDVVRTALGRAGIEPARVEYVEAHGTGTALGDPIELRALDAVLGPGRAPEQTLLVGSVKPNIGHLEPAAGAAGLLKLLLAMRHGEVPPHLNLGNPNPNIAWDRLRLRVPTSCEPWPQRAAAQDRPGHGERVGAISSFGASGTNAHAVLTFAPSAPAAQDPVSPGTQPATAGPTPGDKAAADAPALFLASARTEAALVELSRRLVLDLRRRTDLPLADVCHTSHVGRARQTHGLAVTATTTDELVDALDAYARGERGKAVRTVLPPHRARGVAWLFTGQGSQYPGMGRELREQPAFRAAFEECASVFDPLLDRPLAEVVWPDGAAPGHKSPIDDTRYTQPALFAFEYSLARMWQSWGARPAALAGHSIGEIVAACVAGVFPVGDAARLVAARAALMAALPAGGAMASLTCDEATAREAIAGYPDTLAVAAVNSPRDTVISGAADDVTAVVDQLAARGVKAVRLTVSHAFHSPLLRPMLADFRAVLDQLTYAEPGIPLISNVTGVAWTAAEVGPEYWVRHAAGAVRFHDAVLTLHGRGLRTFLELGPSPILSALGARCLPDGDAADAVFVPAVRRGADARAAILRAVGEVYQRGGQLDWAAFHTGEPVRRVPLPTTPWHGESFWFKEIGSGAEPSGSTSQTTVTPAVPPPGAPNDPVAGIGPRVDSAVPAYRLRAEDPHWLPITRTGPDGRRFLPLGALIATVLAAARDCLGGAWNCVEDVHVVEPLTLERMAEGTAQLTILPTDDGHAVFEFRSAGPDRAFGAPWRLHSRGVLRRRATTTAFADLLRQRPDLEQCPAARTLPVATEALSAVTAEAIAGAGLGDGALLVALQPGRAHGWAEIADAAVAAVSWAAELPDAQVGAAVRFTGLACDDPARVAYVQAEPPAVGDGRVVGAVGFYSEDGRVIGGLHELSIVGPADAPAEAASWHDPADLVQSVQWRPAEPGGATWDPAGGSVLLIADRRGFADRFAAALRGAGANPTVRAVPIVGVDRDSLPDGEKLTALLDEWLTEHASATDRRIVVLTGLDAPHLDHTDSRALEEYLARADLTVVALIKELLNRPEAAGTRLSLVTRGAMPAVAGSPPVSPAAHTLWGLGRVLALEHPDLWGGLVDLDPDASRDDADALVAALVAAGGEDQQALRAGGRLVPRVVLEPAPPAAAPAGPPPVRPDGVYLITGGLGGIGLSVAGWLARAGAGRLVLMARSRLPDRSSWDDDLPAEVRARVEAVRALERLGTEVDVVSCDVADAAAVAEVFAAIESGTKRLRGVVHAAGISLPEFVREVDPENYRLVCRPKLVGGWITHQLSATADVDFYIGFSSIAAAWGSQHLASYSAANAFLDGLAHHRAALGLRTLVVDWGPWDLPSALFGADVMAFLKSTGLRPLASGQCLDTLGALLAAGHDHAVVCAADWSVYRPVMEARLDRPMFALLGIDDEDASTGEAPAALTALLAAEDRPAAVVDFLRGAVADVLAADPGTLDPDAEVLGYGLDSLMAMEVVRQCKHDLGLTVKAAELFERGTIRAWAEHVCELIEGGSGTGGAGAAASGASTGPTARATATRMPSDPAWLARDAVLDPVIRPVSGGSEQPGAKTGRPAFLTGATGFLGAYLLDELLAQTDDPVVCLVRCPDPETGLARVRQNSEKYLPWRPDADERVRILPGDLAEPRLGLGQERFEELADEISVVYHNGAWVNFGYTYEQLRATNVRGTEEVLRLAALGSVPVHHVSTYGIWGIPEDGRAAVGEDDAISGAGRLVTGYVQSKWAAEHLVAQAAERGLPVAVYRPGRVLGDSRTGACLTTHFTTRVMKGCVQLGLAPLLDLDVEMTPVDYVCGALVRIARGGPATGAAFHLVNPVKMTFAELIAGLRRHGWRLDPVPVSDWWRVLQDAYGLRPNELHAVMDVVEAFVVGGEEAVDYGVANAEQALAGSGLACPPLDDALLGRYLDWLVADGYLPQPQGIERSKHDRA